MTVYRKVFGGIVLSLSTSMGLISCGDTAFPAVVPDDSSQWKQSWFIDPELLDDADYPSAIVAFVEDVNDTCRAFNRVREEYFYITPGVDNRRYERKSDSNSRKADQEVAEVEAAMAAFQPGNWAQRGAQKWNSCIAAWDTESTVRGEKISTDGLRCHVDPLKDPRNANNKCLVFAGFPYKWPFKFYFSSSAVDSGKAYPGDLIEIAGGYLHPSQEGDFESFDIGGEYSITVVAEEAVVTETVQAFSESFNAEMPYRRYLKDEG